MSSQEQKIEYDFSGPPEITDKDLVMAGQFTGLIDSLSNEDYHKAPGLSFSGLKEFAKTPAHYKAYLRRDKKPTAAQILGTRVHMAVLETERFENTFVVAPKAADHPDALRTTDDIKAKLSELGLKVSGSKADITARLKAADPKAVFWDEVCSDITGGKELLDREDYDQIRFAAEAILSHPIASSLLSKGSSEQSLFWRDPKTGILLKCRPDHLRSDGVIMDVKTFGQDLDDHSLMQQIYRMQYHFQSQHYLSGANHVLGTNSNMFAHAFVQVEDPYLVRVIVLNDASLEKAAFDMAPLYERFAECERTGKWPGYGTDITELALPDWAWK